MKKMSKTKEEFDQFYEEKIKGEIEELEADRKNLKKRRNKQAKTTIVAALIPIVLGLIFSDYFIAFFIATFVVLIFGFSKLSKTYRSFEGVMKQRIVRKVVTLRDRGVRFLVPLNRKCLACWTILMSDCQAFFVCQTH